MHLYGKLRKFAISEKQKVLCLGKNKCQNNPLDFSLFLPQTLHICNNILHEIICIDDASIDNTKEVVEKNNILFFTHEHKGYGGNLFEGLKIAFKRGATHVIEIHGDGQYDLKRIIDVKKISAIGTIFIIIKAFLSITIMYFQLLFVCFSAC